MKPSIGRMVHYVSYGTPNGEYKPECRAAVITAVLEVEEGGVGILVPSVSLCVLNPEGLFFNKNVPYREEPSGGSWHWPERVEE